MSLHALATNMASKGRNGDSMLVHMTPGEVHGLQALAMKHGGSLTINPDTGLPEANFLKSLLPMLAGFALNAFVPGLGAAVGGMFGASAAVGTGIAVGGITGLATGSLSKGLMAGLGAYGGAGLSEGLLGAGAASGAGQTLATEAATQAGLEGITLPTDYASLAARTATPEQIAAARAAATPGDLLAAGAKSAAADPMAFAKANFKPLAAAASPIMADMMVPTTTQAPSPMAPGRIREKRWNGQYFEDVASTDAGVYNTSGRNFSDLYRGYNNGGIVALANGGVPGYAGATGSLVKDASGMTQADINAALAAELGARGGTSRADLTNYAKSAYGLSDAQINAAYNTIPAPSANATTDTGLANANANANAAGSMMPNANTQAPTGLAQLDTTTKIANNAATGTTAPPAGETPDARAARLFRETGSWEAANALRTQQDTAANALRATQDAAAVADPNYWTNKAGLAALAPGASDTTKWYAARGLGFDPIDTVIDNFLLKYKTQLASMTPEQQTKAMTDALAKEKLNEADVIKATGFTIAQLVAPKRADGSIIVAGDIKDVPVGALPGGVSGGADTFINANGTVTTRPDIPGRPEGGSFTGMTDVRKAYTDGGGSLGYTSPVPTSLEAFNKTYATDRMSGDSLAAYEYLTGKKGATYPTKSGVGQIARPYDEAVLGYPARGNLPFTYDKATGKMVRNMDYVAPGRDDKGNVTYGMSLNDIKKSLTDAPLSGQALYDWAQTNKVSAQQIADATGKSLSSVYADFRKGATAKAAVTNADGTIDETKVAEKALADEKEYFDEAAYLAKYPDVANELKTGKSVSGQPVQYTSGYEHYMKYGKGSTTHAPIFKAGYTPPVAKANGGIMGYAMGGMPGYALGGLGNLGGYSDGGRLLKGPGDGVSDSIPATIGRKQQPARLADGEFVVPARIVSELGNGSTDAGAKKLYAMMDRVQRARGKTTGKNKVAANSRADKYLPA